jgi:glycosyltransferase involved in cell wall biosynthesis
MFVGGPLKPGYLEEVQAKVQKLPHASRFVFTGFQSDIPAYMAASDVICLTSEIEAHSKVILQSLAMGKIVVASKVGGSPELVRHGENGLLYERNAGALAAAVDTALAGDRQQIIANALADAERLDINRVMAENEKLYAALTA